MCSLFGSESTHFAVNFFIQCTVYHCYCRFVVHSNYLPQAHAKILLYRGIPQHPYRKAQTTLKMTLLATRRLLVATGRGPVHGRNFHLGTHNRFISFAPRTPSHVQRPTHRSLQTQPGHAKFSVAAAATQGWGCPLTWAHLNKSSVTVTSFVPSRCYSNNSDELSPLRRGWMRLAGLIKAFMDGTKALYRDVKLMYELRKRSGSLVISQDAPRGVSPGKVDFPFTRQEVQFMYQVRRRFDSWKVNLLLCAEPLQTQSVTLQDL